MITKTKPSIRQSWHNRTVLKFVWTSTQKPFIEQTYTDTRNFQSLGETITYEEGPRVIGIAPTHPNWKRCIHSGKPTRFSGCDYNCDLLQVGNPFTTSVRSYGVNPFVGYPWTFPSTPDMPAIDLSDLYNRMYSDLAGRVDSYFLSLEDLAGLVSGNSFLKTVGSVALATNKFTVAVAQLKRLKRKFGRRASLYQMWTKSADLVRELIGLRLGYRFAFRATLSDIVEAVDAATSLSADVRRLAIRNSKNVLHFVKNATAENVNESIMSGSDFGSKFYHCFAEEVNPLPPAAVRPPAILRSTASCSAQLHCWASVRYPERYVTAARILQSRFGLDKPLSTLWAIVPCSFLIDYLVNVQGLAENADNALNEYDVLVNIHDAWLLKSETRQYEIHWPGFIGIAEQGTRYNCPPLAAKQLMSSTFVRQPVTSAEIMANSSPLLRTDDNGWIQRIGTGLELLLSRRLVSH